MQNHGQEIATCSCGRKYYVYSMTVRDQHVCPICRAEEIEGAEATRKEVEKRGQKKSIHDLIEEMNHDRKKHPGPKFRNRDSMMCCPK